MFVLEGNMFEDKEFRKRFERLRKKNPKLAEDVQGKREGLSRALEEMREGYARVQSMMQHEIKTPLTVIQGYSEILMMDKEYDPEEVRKTAKIINNSAKVLGGILDMVSFHNFSYDQLKSNPKEIILEKLLKAHAVMYEPMLERSENNIGLRLKYNQIEHEPMTIYANPGFINAVFGTLLGNAVSWAPKNSLITEAFRIDERDNLEFLIENVHGKTKKRNSHGTGEGRGVKFVEESVRNIKGEVNYYSEKKIGNGYDVQIIFGNREAKNRSKTVYGVEVKIPMSELRKDS